MWNEFLHKNCGDDYVADFPAAFGLVFHVQIFDLRQADEFYTCRRVFGIFRLRQHVFR